jgi:hypothetical protein
VIKTLYSILVCALALTILSPTGRAGQQSHEDLRKQIIETRELIFHGRYDEASRQFLDLARKYPESPAGDFYQAVTLTWKSYVDAKLEQGSRQHDRAIEELLASTVKKAEAIKARASKAGPDEVESLYYLGSAYAIRSRISLYQNHAIPAARFARIAQQHFDGLIKIEPGNADAYFASGNIYYRAGLLKDSPLGNLAAGVLGAKWLPAGDRQRGLDYLKIAAEKGPLTAVDAKLALIEIYTFTESRFIEALPIARELQSKYPDNQTFARHLLKIYIGLKDRAKLTQAARQILARVKEGRAHFGPFMKSEAERALALANNL